MQQGGNSSLGEGGSHPQQSRCEQCSDLEDGPCVTHSELSVADRAIPPRAIASLPEQLQIRNIAQEGENDSEHGKGVFANTSIPAGTIFGPLIGTLIQPNASRAFNFGLVIDGRVEDGTFVHGSTVMHYRLTSDSACNWMKYVRLSDDPSTVNLMAYQHGGRVYFTALKALVEGDELIAGYSLPYAKAIGKVSPNTNVGLILPDSRQSQQNVVIPIISIPQMSFERIDNINLEILAAAAMTNLAGSSERVGLTTMRSKSPTSLLSPSNLTFLPPRKRGRPRKNITPGSTLPSTERTTQAERQATAEEEVNEAIAQLALLRKANSFLPLQISSIRKIPAHFNIEDDLNNIDEKPQLMFTETFDNDTDLPVVRITETEHESTPVPSSSTPVEDFQLSDFLSTEEQPVGKVVRKRGPYKKRKISEGQVKRVVRRRLSFKAKDSTLPQPDSTEDMTDVEEKQEAPENALEESKQTSVRLPRKKRKLTKKFQRVEVCGALVEIPLAPPRAETSKGPVMEKKKLMETGEKLPVASKLLASNMRYKHKCTEKDCSAQFRIPGLLSIHETTHGKDLPEEYTDEGPKSCPGCQTELADWEALVSHVKSHERQHNRKDRKGRTGGVKCETCSKDFADEKNLATHIQRLHSGEVEKNVKCDQCDRTFFTLAGMKSHENFQHGLRKGFECPVCLEGFKGGLNLNIHGETHRVDGNFPCRLCTKVFPGWLTLLRHMKQQHKTTKLLCAVCQKTFRNQGALDRHQKIHYDAFDYACDICGRRFKQKPLFLAHQKRLHNPDRQYRFKERSEKVAKSFADAVICSICHRQYNSRERLEEHQRVRHGKVASESEAEESE